MPSGRRLADNVPITCHTNWQLASRRDSHETAISLFQCTPGPCLEMSEERDPGPSSDQFDALIELLASDDACDDSNFHIAPEGVTSNGLRDANGKLDYTKIRSLFLQRRVSNDGNHAMHSDALKHDPNSESGLKPPLVSTVRISWRLKRLFIWSILDCGGRTDSFGRRLFTTQAFVTARKYRA